MTEAEVKRAMDLLQRRKSLQEQITGLIQLRRRTPRVDHMDRATLTIPTSPQTNDTCTVTVVVEDVISLLREYLGRVEVELTELRVDFGGSLGL